MDPMQGCKIIVAPFLARLQYTLAFVKSFSRNRARHLQCTWPGRYMGLLQSLNIRDKASQQHCKKWAPVWEPCPRILATTANSHLQKSAGFQDSFSFRSFLNAALLCSGQGFRLSTSTQGGLYVSMKDYNLNSTRIPHMT